MAEAKTTDKPKYYDIRATFWKKHFDMAQDYETYLNESDPDKAKRWRDMAEKIAPPTPEQKERLSAVERGINVLVYSGVWCGDCVRQGPMLKGLADACKAVDLRIIDRDASEELKDEVRILGAMRVPVVIFLTDDYMEIGRFGDRLLNVYRNKAVNELGAACDTGLVPPDEKKLAAEMGEWCDIFERMLLMARLSPAQRQKHGD